LVQIRPQFFLVIVVRQTDTQTNAGKNIPPRFRREKNTMQKMIDK